MTQPSATQPPPAGPAAPTTGAPATTTPTGVPTLDHVVVVVMENLGYRAALSEPAFAALAAKGARLDGYDAVAHPSLPNYLALDTGSTHGITSDCITCYVGGPDLAQQLSSAGIAWDGYFEAMPSACYLGGSVGRYAAKHNPFRYVTGVRSDPAACNRLRPFSDIDAALSGPPGSLPRFAWVTPDICHDGHDCGPAIAGAWLTGFVQRLTASPSWDARSALFVTWDEAEGGDTAGGGGHVLSFVISPSVPAGRRVATALSHYSLLRTVEEALGLPPIGHAADPGRADLGAIWSG